MEFSATETLVVFGIMLGLANEPGLKFATFLWFFSGEIKELEELNADCATLSCSMRS